MYFMKSVVHSGIIYKPKLCFVRKLLVKRGTCAGFAWVAAGRVTNYIDKEAHDNSAIACSYCS